MSGRFFRWGLYGALAVPSLLAMVLVAESALSYQGKCGGLMPFLAGPRPCSFWEYASASLEFTALVLWDAYWPLIVLLLLIPPAVGYLLDRKGTWKLIA